MQSKQWKKVVWAAAAGVSLGVVAATLTISTPSLKQQHAPTAYMVPVVATASHFSASQERPESSADTEELDRLKTRNRRLEALVTVLRHRAAERRQ